MNQQIDLLEELYQILGTEITKEVDAKIIIDILMKDGWFKQTVNPIIPKDELLDWVSANILNEYMHTHTVWMFKNINDFMAFTLRFA